MGQPGHNKFELAMNDYLNEKNIDFKNGRVRKYTQDYENLDAQFPTEISSSFGAHSATAAQRKPRIDKSIIWRSAQRSNRNYYYSDSQKKKKGKRLNKQSSLMSTRSSMKFESTKNELRIFRKLSKYLAK